ncbi:beta strand repeat-containing protein [Stagnihabitans tardus]|uniref:Calcium-binding protein n=1 Tax=Stagnihabitans tardus TaxID=2699202 RepID=A0AAE5BWR8_9RHOB|nr:calcium-binding protein [Stagnihabitans tardus]NBZ88563.1 hypothetical protein [Stagnihabitans tardus]
MTTYSFSTLINNQLIPFDPLTDILLFDSSIRPAELLINATSRGVQFSVAGKSIVLSDTSLDSLGARTGSGIQNVQFQSTGVLIVGEGTTALDGNLANLLTGGLGDDALVGLGGDDVLDGGAGADLMVGGLGNDTYKVDNVGDIVTEENSTTTGSGIDIVLSSVSYTLAAYVENMTLTGGAAVNATGNTLNNFLRGNAAANVLDGKQGADTMIGDDGNDTYYVDSSSDRVVETNSSATQVDTVISTVHFALGANIENLTLTGSVVGLGNSRGNAMTGSSGSNTLNGGYGADTLSGGDGNDTFIVDNAGDAVIETSNSLSQIDMVAASISYTLGANLENLRLLGSGNINATGNALANVLYANAGNNIIDGLGGTDTASYAQVSLATLSTTSTIQTMTVTSSVAGAGVTVDLNITGFQDTQGSGFDKLVGIENLTGSQFNDELTGNSGANILDGNLGADVLIGGKGNDTYRVDGADVVVEAAGLGEGLDTVYASVSYRLTANVEYLILTDSAVSGIGNNLDNRITGNSGSNILDGRAGADKMDGGSGNDTFIVDNLGDEVTDSSGTADMVMTYVNYSLGSTIEHLRLMGINAMNGTGNVLNNTIWANVGDNVIDGMGETLVSGVKGDTLSYEFGASAGITVDLAVTGPQSTGGSGIDTIINVENLIGSYYDDILGGSDTNNVLDGLAGVDTISYVSALTDVTVDLNTEVATTGGSTDQVRNFENVLGSAFDDLMVGTLGDNVFDGGASGSDTVSYRNVLEFEGGVEASLAVAGPQNTQASGFDTFLNIDNLEGSVNDDKLTGSIEANRLDGSAGQDSLYGMNGDDSLTGGIGDDLVDGGRGSDWALFLGAQDAKVDLNKTAAQDTGYGLDKLVAIENVGTGDGDDQITGDGANNKLSAGFGLDTIIGGAGDDALNGGAGADRLTGGTGADSFVFDTAFAADNVDRITDFAAVDDLFQLSSEVFETIAVGMLKAADFQANANGVAVDASDRILYETSTGNLYYDADGTGAAAAVQFAVITPNLVLTAADFQII